MIEVQAMPESDGEVEEDVSEDGEEDEELDEEEEQPDGEQQVDSKNLDEEAFREQMSDRLEDLRHQRALGNDDADQPSSTSPGEDLSESETESKSDASSNGPPATDFTTYTRDRKTGRPPRISVKKLGQKDGVKDMVMKERERAGRGEGMRKPVGAGKMKGHKWKSSDKFLVGKNSAW